MSLEEYCQESDIQGPKLESEKFLHYKNIESGLKVASCLAVQAQDVLQEDIVDDRIDDRSIDGENFDHLDF